MIRMIGRISVAAVLALASLSMANAGDVAKPDPHVPMAPFKIGEGLYYIGSSFYAVYLFVTRDGLIVLDGGDEVVGRQALANIKTLGFRTTDIKVILFTHDHSDHAGGLAEIKRAAAKDAKLYASAKDGAVVAKGGRGDPIVIGDEYYYEPVEPDVILRDKEKVSLGGWTLTAHLTPGHTAGCTTWTFPVTVAGRVRHGVAPCSWALLPGVKLGKTETYHGITADYIKSFKTWKSLPCEVFIASSNQFFNFKEKKAALDGGDAEAFVDPLGCRNFYAKAEESFRNELRRQNE